VGGSHLAWKATGAQTGGEGAHPLAGVGRSADPALGLAIVARALEHAAANGRGARPTDLLELEAARAHGPAGAHGQRCVGPPPYRGESDWARNLRAARRGRLAKQGRVEAVDVVEVAVAERAALLEIYSARYGKMPTVAATLRALPDPADDPIFRITDSRPAM
jgi:hypothetical protein